MTIDIFTLLDLIGKLLRIALSLVSAYEWLKRRSVTHSPRISATVSPFPARLTMR